MTACSDFFDEPLPGTALEATRWVCVEFSHGWGHDALDGHALGEELASQIKAHMNAHNARFQFIREPGSGGQDSGGHRVLIAESTPGHEALYATTIGSVSDLLSLDVSHPETIPGVTALDSPVALICTHGKRDVCCALKGRPVAALLSQHASGSTDGADAPETTSARVWETSHTGGRARKRRARSGIWRLMARLSWICCVGAVRFPSRGRPPRWQCGLAFTSPGLPMWLRWRTRVRRCSGSCVQMETPTRLRSCRRRVTCPRVLPRAARAIKRSRCSALRCCDVHIMRCGSHFLRVRSVHGTQ